MKAVILAGGRGSRMASLFPNTPKPLIKLCSRTVAEYQFEALKQAGIRDIIFVTGYKGEAVEDYFSDGAEFGLNTEYIRESTPRGTGGVISSFSGIDDDFLVLNSDVFFDADISRFIAFFSEKNALCALWTHPGKHPADSEIVISREDGAVTGWSERGGSRYAVKNLVNAGIYAFSRDIFNFIKSSETADLDADIVAGLINTGRVFAYRSTEYVCDTGTPERFFAVENDMKLSIPQKMRHGVKKRAVFLDRDGCLNVYKGDICSPEQLELTKGAAQAVAKLNSLGYLTVLITNQPGIAKGYFDVEMLERIHGRLEMLLGEGGAYLDDIYYCPHHPEKGFPGERPEYKIICDCRKPAPGMILRAAEKYNIDLENSYMVGDSRGDVETGINAGCKSIFVRSAFGDEPPVGTEVYDSLYDFVAQIDG